ncbi:gluconate 5-dehydrogenase [Alkalihalophilus pseudofirmus]|nr:gluconate 5-dehydrogenase [Alkalihalophilus pseudofirmus]
MLEEIFSLTGKTAVVTGGTGHLGLAISEGLAKAGATVYIGSRNDKKGKEIADKFNENLHVNCLSINFDIADPISIKEGLEKINQETGSIDILVNNAYYGKSGTIEQMTEDDWQLGMDGTINGVFRCTKAVLPYMVLQKSGSIVNISSMYGVVSPNPEIYVSSNSHNPPSYGAGKAAILQLTRYVACHYGKHGIRANSISPGPFPNSEVQKNQDFIKKLVEKNPLNRIGEPKDLIGVSIFLSSQASSYVTGQNICVDGGWTAW